MADYCKQLSKVTEDANLWSPSARFHEINQRYVESTPTMIPLTPISRVSTTLERFFFLSFFFLVTQRVHYILRGHFFQGYEVSSPYSEHEGSSPPEAAIEATPETTPIRVSTIPHRAGSLEVSRNLTTQTCSLVIGQDHFQSPAPLLITAPPAAGCSTRSIVSFPTTSEAAAAAGFSHGSKVPITDRSFPSSPIKREPSASAFRYSAPEIQPVLAATTAVATQPLPMLKKVDKLLNDRCQVRFLRAGVGWGEESV